MTVCRHGAGWSRSCRFLGDQLAFFYSLGFISLTAAISQYKAGLLTVVLTSLLFAEHVQWSQCCICILETRCSWKIQDEVERVTCREAGRYLDLSA